MLGDLLEMSVALRGRGFGRATRHGCRTWRDDNDRFGGVLGNTGVDAVSVVPTITGERGYRTCNPIEQGADLGTIGETRP